MCVRSGVVVLVVLGQICHAQFTVRSPPRVEDKPNLLDSFIPAAMQIMAHLTELMKYDLKPTTSPPYGTTASTASTAWPTPPHKPGIYAPLKPPGPEAYFSHKDFNFREYLERLQQPTGFNYFDRYRYPLNDDLPPAVQKTRNSQSRSYSSFNVAGSVHTNVVPVDYELYFGKGFSDLVQLVRRIEPDYVPFDVDNQVQDFSKEYDDSDFRFELLRQKKVPPTRAYVTLLSLYDLLNKESKRLGLNKYQGYADNVLRDLIQSSTSTSAYQLRTVMSKIVERGDTKKPDIVKKINQLVTDLDESGSYINDALKYIPPLPFTA